MKMFGIEKLWQKPKSSLIEKGSRSFLTEEERRLLQAQRELTPVSKPEERMLESREKTSSQKLEGGINKTEILKLKDDGSVVFKPKEGEGGGWIEWRGTQFKRERAAYLVSQFWGIDLVPPTVIREVDSRIGSAQQFVADAKTIFEGGRLSGDSVYNEYPKLYLFDYVVWNIDRHNSNYLIKDNRIYAIDHGLCFRSEKIVEPSDNPFYLEAKSNPSWILDRAIPKDVIEKLQRLASDENYLGLLKSLLSELLRKDEVQSCLQRIQFLSKLAAKGKIEEEDLRSLVFAPNI